MHMIKGMFSLTSFWKIHYFKNRKIKSMNCLYKLIMTILHKNKKIKCKII